MSTSIHRVVLSFLGLSGLVLAGCPIYGDTYYSEPQQSGCVRPDDCATGSTCATDGHCYTSTCADVGCPTGYSCALTGGAVQCTKDIAKPDAGPGGCTSDPQCASVATGAKCLNGTCVAPTEQCSDATQCNGNAACVDGVCTPKCVDNTNCPTGYSCDTAKGICSGNPNPCGSGGTACAGTNVCVDAHCVAPCDADNKCGTNLICVQGGCVPDEKPSFVCNTEGVQDACAKGSVCLHHNCYIGCSTDADGSTSCANADRFNLCKNVSTSTGSVNVCGSSTNLGSECDPTQSKNCASGVCIDGFCR